jgi:hypothetical protein
MTRNNTSSSPSYGQRNQSNNNRGKKPYKPATGPATHWRSPDAEIEGFAGTSPRPSTAANAPDPREVFAVVNHEGLQALYCWKDDAVAHAKVCAGKVQTMRVQYELPPWVKVMVDRATDLAAMQAGKHTIH